MSENDIKQLIATVSRLSTCLEFLKKNVDQMHKEIKSSCNNCGLKEEFTNLRSYQTQIKILWAMVSAVFLKMVVKWLNLL